MNDFRQYKAIDYCFYVSHHGILGMHWGDRNGPPYPLDAGDHSPSENRAGWRNSLDGNGPLASEKKKSKKVNTENKSEKKPNIESKNEKKKGLTKRQKTAIKIGMAAAGAALVGIGAYQLYKRRDLIAAGMKRAKSSTEDTESIRSRSSENRLFSKIEHSETTEEMLKKINPKLSSGIEYKMNCGNCAIATELRRRGFDVTAKGNPIGITIDAMKKYCNISDKKNAIQLSNKIKNAPITSFGSISYGQSIEKSITSCLSKQFPSGSRGTLFVPLPFCAHWITWEIDSGGVVKFLNSQDTNLNLTKDVFSNYMPQGEADLALTAIRLDNVAFDDRLEELVEKIRRK